MFSDPVHNIEQFGITPAHSVADLGAGSGFYTLAAARKIKSLATGDETGKVYAVEVQKDLLARIKDVADKEHLTNIEYIWGDIEKRGGTKLRDHSIDRVIASNVFFQVEDKKGFLSEIGRILKPDGQVLLIDWSESFSGMGPAPKDVITKFTAKDLFSAAGFTLDREISAGAHHYGLIFKK